MRLVKDHEGGVAVLTAVSLTTLLGFAGLGTEATLWYVAKRNMQGATDAAAFTAATAENAGQNSTAFAAAAKAITAQYGFTNGADNVVVTVNNPPQSGSYTTNSSAIEVIVQQRQTMLFSGLFMSTAPTISARAVAVATPTTSGSGGGDGCVLALDSGNVTDVTDSGSTSLQLNNCSIYVNGSSSSALTLSGGAVINSKSAYISGNYTTAGGAALNTTAGTHTGVNPAPDPYASVNVPSYSGCDRTTSVTTVSTQTVNLQPSTPGGTYVICGGITASGQSTVNLAPGVYILNGGSISIAGGSTLTGSGVTIILTSSTGTSYGTVSLAGGSNINVTAPTSGATAGLAFFQDRNAPNTKSNNFTGGATQSVTGAIYFPNQTVTYSGGNVNAPAPCTQLIGLKLSFVGNSVLNASCDGTGVKSIGSGSTGNAGQVALVE
ncbi:MAG TPA: pilus assembly protein TadG-related protein [Stellaceae bacterium]|nr:pilus assembly protein TadG-related protein [Stellaceae bacterium]